MTNSLTKNLPIIPSLLQKTKNRSEFFLKVFAFCLFPFLAPLESYFKVDCFDEAFARIHLGFMDKNIDIFLARICFRGHAGYNLNILQVFITTGCILPIGQSVLLPRIQTFLS